MSMKLRLLSSGIAILAIGVSWHVFGASPDTSGSCTDQKSVWCIAPRDKGEIDTLYGATVPKLATPAWFAPKAPVIKTVTYSFTTKGVVTANMDEFRSVVAATLNDSRGWTRLGVAFEVVDSGGDFTVYLANAAELPSFHPVCDTFTSCSIGRNIVINQDRWVGGAPAWNNAGGDLTGYRQYVINHEVGHWLGHGHRTCQASGQPSPLMQQQTLNLNGCVPNPWPLTSEMYSPSLGIRS